MGFPDSLFISPDTLPPDGYGFFQLVFLMLVYGLILSYSANLISDGSELLLLIPQLAGIVGSVVLPVVNAAPESAIMLFSGLGPDAQNQIGVGVGALAGSTIMLLTIPWALCVIAGRVTIVRGKAHYRGKPRLREEGKWSLLGVGISPRSSVSSNGRMMVLTALSYFIIQGAAFGSDCYMESNDSNGSTSTINNAIGSGSGSDCRKNNEYWFALASLVTCLLLLAAYLYYNIRHAQDEDREDLIMEVKKQAIESHIISLSTAFDKELSEVLQGEDASLLSKQEVDKRFKFTLRSFFKKYDCNGDGVIDRTELRLLLADLNERVDEGTINGLLREMDCDRTGTINFDEFCSAMQMIVKRGLSALRKSTSSRIVFKRLSIHDHTDEETPGMTDYDEAEEEDDEEEDEEDQDDDDSPNEEENEQPRYKILLKAAWMMGIGTVGTLLFSDPMVDCFSELGARIDIKPFYVAFVLAPIGSNISELIASINYAMKKTRKSITISLAALEGSVCMNNTFCLGIFLSMIFAKGLAWEFSAETISIIFVEIAMAFVCTFRKTQTLLDAIFILALFPTSLVIVWVLENQVNLN